MCDVGNGLILPVTEVNTDAALIFLLLDSSSNRFFAASPFMDSGKIEAVCIAALLSRLFLSNLAENFTQDAAIVSSSQAGVEKNPQDIIH